MLMYFLYQFTLYCKIFIQYKTYLKLALSIVFNFVQYWKFEMIKIVTEIETKMPNVQNRSCLPCRIVEKFWNIWHRFDVLDPVTKVRLG